jgi:hypothetical protein
MAKPTDESHQLQIPNQELSDVVLSDEMLDVVAGGAEPSPHPGPGPVPIPYPNTLSNGLTRR